MAAKQAKPIGGFPSKGEAILAMLADGKTPFIIAEALETTVDTVYQIKSAAKRKAAAAGAPPAEKKRPGRKAKPAPIADHEQPDATPGIWTPEKLTKARRLFGLSMNMIAEALQVPPAELLAYGLSGVIPPIGERQRVGQLLTQMQDRAPAPTTPALPPPDFIEGNIVQVTVTPPLETLAPATQDAVLALAAAAVATLAEPDRDDDEAELAALEQQEQTDDENAGTDYRGVNGGDGSGAVQQQPSLSEPASELRPEPAAHLVDDAGRHAPAEQGGETPAPQSAPPADAPPAETGEVIRPRLYRIPRPGGGYVHKSGEGTTRKPPEAWIGDARELEKLLKRYPELQDLDPEKVPG